MTSAHRAAAAVAGSVRARDGRIPNPDTSVCRQLQRESSPSRSAFLPAIPTRTAAAKDLPRMALAAGALLVLACGHTDPFSVPPYGATEPFDPTPPIRLTQNAGPDREGSWLV